MPILGIICDALMSQRHRGAEAQSINRRIFEVASQQSPPPLLCASAPLRHEPNTDRHTHEQRAP